MVGRLRDAATAKGANMPKERVRASGNNGYADILVRWDKQGTNDHDLRVNLFVASKELPGYDGGFYFHPNNPEALGLKNVDSIGPVLIDLDRTQINRLIRTLRTARDSAYGHDE